jgi:hypothetical protein
VKQSRFGVKHPAFVESILLLCEAILLLGGAALSALRSSFRFL